MGDLQRDLPGVAKILGENPDEPRGKKESEMAEILEMLAELNAQKPEAGSDEEEEWNKKIAKAKERLAEVEGIDVDVSDL